MAKNHHGDRRNTVGKENALKKLKTNVYIGNNALKKRTHRLQKIFDVAFLFSF